MKKQKDILQKAVQLMPADPIVNDHYADSFVDDWRKKYKQDITGIMFLI